MPSRRDKGKAWKRGKCVYCGKAIDLRYLTCSAHADLPQRDPRYAGDYFEDGGAIGSDE